MSSEFGTQALRDALLTLVRRRVPVRDAEDVVQSALAEALASPHRPDDSLAARRWLYGIVRNKVADYHRHARREWVGTESDPPADPSHDAHDTHEADDLLRWALRELPEGASAQETLAWLVREADGEKLEAIAEDAQLPAAQVRQRVSRLRRHFRARWAVYLALAGATALLLYLTLRRGTDSPMHALPRPAPIAPAPEILAARDRARAFRAQAFAACDAAQWQHCLDDFDAARQLDPAGDSAPDVIDARRRATDALAHPAHPIERPQDHLGDLGLPMPTMSTMSSDSTVRHPRRHGSPPRVSSSSDAPPNGPGHATHTGSSGAP